jgi:Flp pilus assembly protein TadG
MQRNQNKSERGHALLEFALGWTVLWMLFSGVYQFGYSFYTYNALGTSVANAAELGSKLDYDTANTAAFASALQNMVVYGDKTAGSKPLVPGLSTSNVNVQVTLDSNSMPHDVSVSLSSYTIDTIFKTFTLTNKPRATVLYMGRVVCSTC